LLMGALAGADTFGHMGICGADQGASLEQMIVDNEMAGFVKRVLGSFEVNADTLALDVIKQVGIGGDFLSHDHTVSHFRKELWFPAGFDRRSWDDFWNDGAKTMADWAREKKESILKDHHVEPVDEKLAAELDKIVDAGMKALGKS